MPDVLPRLQFTLTELFERRSGSMLRLADYHQNGGLERSLSQRAEAIYESLPQKQQMVARQIFLRMVTPGDGTQDTLRRVYRAELVELAEQRDDLSAVLDTFGDYRLLTFDVDSSTREPMVSIAHE
ncbi:MAG: XRE family transcriptional regulator, partial [Leptolyngbyaceae cyanobacterium RM2_2_21]|nr:XRE family transcriptional regulator [Leptolyngbyaceae cyanobacterium RM2_2_21]